jgi:hypothetical protein
MQGIITFYINFHPDLGQDVEKTIEIFKQMNKDLIDHINKDSGYLVAIVPTTKESCRIEKVDFDKPFPRFVPNYTNITDAEKRKEDRAAERAYAKEERNRDQKEN